MKIDYKPIYNYRELYQEIFEFLKKQKYEIIKCEFNMADNDYYCRIKFILMKKCVNISITPYDEFTVLIGFSYWQCENKIVDSNSPVIEYSILKVHPTKESFSNTIKQYLKIFKKMLKVHLRNYKEIKNEVKIKLYGKYKIK